MTDSLLCQASDITSVPETELIDLARLGDEPAIRQLIRRHNQRLFRAARSVVRDDAEAEDVVQASYVKAFTRLDGFRGDASFITWLTRIVLNEALERLRRQRPSVPLDGLETGADTAEITAVPALSPSSDPELEVSRNQVRALLEQAIDALPETFRSVFVLRDVQGLNIAETAEQLGIRTETVKTRLHRARGLMRQSLESEFDGAFATLFPFKGPRCLALADRVIDRMRNDQPQP